MFTFLDSRREDKRSGLNVASITRMLLVNLFYESSCTILLLL
jgi:hypothetical protein